MLIIIQKPARCSKQIIKILTDHRNHQSSSKTFQRPKANSITNIQNTNNTHSTKWQWNLNTKGKRQIQNHSSRDEIFEKNHKIYTVCPQKESRHHEWTQNTTSSRKKITITNTNAYNTFAEWTYLSSHKLLWNTNQQETETQVSHSRDF
jgi:hypothetical protein